jgi:hypothetical protein
VEPGSPKIQATSVISEQLPKANNYPMGKNSPNLVTLFADKKMSVSSIRFLAGKS